MYEGSEVARWERRENSEVARSERWEGSGVARWEVPGFIQGRVQDLVFLMLINETKKQEVFKIFLGNRRDRNAFLRSYTSCYKAFRIRNYRLI